MHKSYTLLRNNKQSGPYTLEELVQFSLKSQDLIWIEGNKGWQNPSEIGELKDYVLEVSKSLSEHPIEASKKITHSNAADPQIGLDSGEKKKTPDGLSKSIHVSLPKTIQERKPFQEATDADNLEKKAQKLFEKVQAFEQQKREETATLQVDTRYRRSLDDIKEEYVNWLQKQEKKSNKKSTGKSKSIVALAVTTLLAGSILYQWLSDNGIFFNNQVASKPITSLKDSSIDVQKMTTQEKKVVNDDNSSFYLENEIATAKSKKIIDYGSQKIDKKNNEEDVVVNDARHESTAIKTESGNLDTNIAKSKSAHNDTLTDSSLSETKIDKEAKPITELIELKGDAVFIANSIILDSYELQLKNNSEKLLKVVAVDVFYYDENKSLLEKKTAYFSNLTPGASSTKNIPASKGAVTAHHQLGLVSTEGTLFFARQ